MLKQSLNIAILTISLFAISILAVISLFGSWAYDEGTIDSNILASVFQVVRFPTHTLFWEFFNQTTRTFYAGLILNILFYSLVIERMIVLIKTQK
jgi:hypothetical protein